MAKITSDAMVLVKRWVRECDLVVAEVHQEALAKYIEAALGEEYRAGLDSGVAQAERWE